jgi:hypothetical protein
MSGEDKQATQGACRRTVCAHLGQRDHAAEFDATGFFLFKVNVCWQLVQANSCRFQLQFQLCLHSLETSACAVYGMVCQQHFRREGMPCFKSYPVRVRLGRVEHHQHQVS